MSIKVFTKIANVRTPQRSTEYSAGYDVFSDRDIEIKSASIAHVVLPSGIEFNPEIHKVLIFLRSSMGMKKNLRLIANKDIVPFLELEYHQPHKHQTITLMNVGKEDFVLEQDMHFLQFIVVDKDESYLPFSHEKVPGTNRIPLSIRETNKGIQLIIEQSVKIPAGERVVIASGLKFRIKLDSFLAGFVPEGEERFRFSNGTSIIDADYVDNPDTNGECFFSVDNLLEEELELVPGTPLVDLISIPYYKAENEVIPTKKRTGGIGSTTN